MAEIKMDISEYEAMKENKKLLENSLEKERELQKQINKLNEEKNKALEDAKMKVIKIIRQESHEYTLIKKDINEIWNNIIYALIPSMNINDYPQIPSNYYTDFLIDSFFEKVKTTSIPSEEVTTHGLDDIKNELKNTIKNELDESIKNKIKNAEIVLSKNDELLKENQNLLKENNLAKEKNDFLLKQNSEVIGKLTKIENQNESINKIKEVLKNDYNFWNCLKILNKINIIMNNNKL